MHKEKVPPTLGVSLSDIKVDLNQFITINNKINRLQAIFRRRNVLSKLKS